jgi:hypothetical protein
MSRKIAQFLLEKLEQETRRSTFINCLQGFSSGTRFDVTRLNQINPFTARDLLRTLFLSETGEVEVKITFDVPAESLVDQYKYSLASDELDDLFRKLYSKGADLFRETGQYSTYVGFPLLSHFDPFDESKSFMAPLMFWPVTITPSKNLDRWLIAKKDGGEIRLNYALKNWLQDNKMRLPDEPDGEILELGTITHEQLESYLVSVAEIFNVPGKWRDQYFVTDTLGPEPLRYGNLKSFDAEQHRIGFDLHLSAVIGIFQANKEGIIQDLKVYLSQNETLDIDEAGIDLFPEFPFSLVDLDPAQWNTHETIGKGGHAVVHGPPGTGKSTVLTGIISTALANNKRVLMISEKRTALEVIAKKLDDLGFQDTYATIADVVSGRREVVMKARSIQDASHKWNPEAVNEYAIERKRWADYHAKYASYCEELNEIMLTGMRFEELMLHYLRLSPTIGELPVSSAMLTRIDSNVGEFHALMEYFLEKHDARWIDFIAFYKANRWPNEVCSDKTGYVCFRDEKLTSLRRDIQLLSKQEVLLQELIPLQEEHDTFMIEGGLVRRVKRLLSKARRRHHHYFGQLCRWNSAANDIMEFRFELERVKATLYDRLNELTLVESFDLSPESIQSCTADFCRLITYNRLEVLDDIMDFLQTSHAAACWEKSVFKVLIQRKKMRMQSTFAWEEMKELMIWVSQQREEGKKRATNYYQRNVHREIKRVDKSYGMRRLYNLRGGRGQERNSLRQIVQSDPELFFSLFPVTLCTPEVASILFRGTRKLFDLVIFDEASQIRLEDAFIGLLKGRTVVIAGDRHQMPPSNWFEADADDRLMMELSDNVTDLLPQQALHAESILDFAIQHRYFGDTYLTYHYRSEHADLIAFSNAAFYGNLRPMALNHIQKPFGFHAVNGFYSSQTNEQEALAVVKWLLAIEPNDQDELPSIGVVTLNLKQRDLIMKLMMRERRISEEANHKIARLDEAGLFVRNLENIQGDERDIIVLSTTFGANREGLFAKYFGKLGTRAGYRLLNVLVTRARTHIHVFTSFPEISFQEYAASLIEKRGNWGSGLIFAYIEFVRRKAAGESTESLLALLSSLRENEVEASTPTIEDTRQILVSKLIKEADPSGDYYIAASLAGILVDAHNHASSYHLHLGAGISDNTKLVHAMHRLNYLEGLGVEVKELA